MAKKKASIKGRRGEILSGEKAPPKKSALELEQEVDIEELPSEPKKVSVTLKVEEPPAPPAEEIVPSPTHPPVTPAPTVETPPTEMPASMPEPASAEAAPGSPPRVAEPAPAEAVPTAPPGRPLVSSYDRPPAEIEPGGYLLKHPVAVGEEAGLPTGVVPREERIGAEWAEEIPPRISLRVDERTVLIRLGKERQQALIEKIDALFGEVVEKLSLDNSLEESLSLLREARAITIETPRLFDQAEYRVAKVSAILERRKTSGRWSVIYGYPVFLYNVICFLLLLGCLLFDHPLAVFIANVTGMTFSDLASLSLDHISPYWNTMVWGGIGGVMGSLYSLYWHMSVVKDFDNQYLMWYIVQPIMGFALGGIVYLIIAAGFVSIQMLTGQTASVSGTAQTMTGPIIRAFYSAVAVVAGFRQRFVFEMIDRIVQERAHAYYEKLMKAQKKPRDVYAEREAEEKEEEEEREKTG